MADYVHVPLLIIGHPHTIQKDGRLVTPWRVEKIHVQDMTFDGNRARHYVSRKCGETHSDGAPTSIRGNLGCVSDDGQSVVASDTQCEK